MASVFTKIIKGEIPAFKIAEDEKYLAFLDVNPLVEGHTLVIPKEEIDYVFDLDDVQLAGLFLFAKKVAKALKASVSCKRIGISVIGLEVPHVHVHLVPLNEMDDINFSRPKKSFPKEKMEKLAEKIKANF